MINMTLTRNEKHYLTEMQIDWVERFGRTPTKEEMEKAIKNLRKRG